MGHVEDAARDAAQTMTGINASLTPAAHRGITSRPGRLSMKSPATSQCETTIIEIGGRLAVRDGVGCNGQSFSNYA
jgi:hypothetical protein